MKLARFSMGLGTGLALGAAVTAFAATRSYQYTGVVTDVTPNKLDVNKGGEVWDFALDGATKGTAEVKQGDKVTVTYRMLATKIEKK